MINNNLTMTSEEFVEEFKLLRDDLIQSYFTVDSENITNQSIRKIWYES